MAQVSSLVSDFSAIGIVEIQISRFVSIRVFLQLPTTEDDGTFDVPLDFLLVCGEIIDH